MGPVEQVERAASAVGFRPDAEPDSVEETTRQADLARLLALAREFQAAHPGEGVPGFVAELARRFSTEETGRGVNLLTYHRAKGLEFEAVFLPRLLDGELPFRSGRSKAPVDEERRLLYVGITRARRHLLMSWPRDQRAGRSPLLDELLPAAAHRPAAATARAAAPRPAPEGRGGVFDALKRWRLERSKADAVPAYVVFHDRTLAAIAERRPRSRTDLAAIPGIGPAKLERYADQVLAVVGGAVDAGDAGSS
jgi:DNA helicase II / ATP-dependent DNA helicase PcrA